MGVGYCTGRKDEFFFEHMADGCGHGPIKAYMSPHMFVQPLAAPPSFQPVKPPHPNFAGAEDEPETLLPRLARLLRAYGEEVHGGHGLMTAADSYYFALLEFQRRYDTVGIQAEVVGDVAAGAVVGAAEGIGEDGRCWRERLAEKRAEAVEALVNRAKHYAVGRRSASSGLLQITSGAGAASTLSDYEALLDEEYETAASEIEAVLATLNSEPDTARRIGRARALAAELARSAAFWETEIEDTFEVWQGASMRLNQAQAERDGVWGELASAASELLAELLPDPGRRPREDDFYCTAPGGSQGGAEHARLQLCVRLLELDIHQYAHGLESRPRRVLLGRLLASARADNALSLVGRALAGDPTFFALGELRIGGTTGRAALDILSAPDHPWAREVAEIFCELVVSAARCPCEHTSAASRAVELLLGGAAQADGCPWAEVFEAAATRVEPVTLKTPLHQAVLGGSAWLAGRLLELRADPLLCDAAGSSPLTLARRDASCSPALLRALEAAAAAGEVKVGRSTKGEALEEWHD